MNQSQSEADSQKTAAVIDVWKLAQCCKRLVDENQSLNQRRADDEAMIGQLNETNQQLNRFADFAQRELDEQKKAIRSRMRAVTHFSGDMERMRRVEYVLNSADTPPEEIRRLHGEITKEFQALYPTRAASGISDVDEFNSNQAVDYSCFRLQQNS